jgi:hypothetical protein
LATGYDRPLPVFLTDIASLSRTYLQAVDISITPRGPLSIRVIRESPLRTWIVAMEVLQGMNDMERIRKLG